MSESVTLMMIGLLIIAPLVSPFTDMFPPRQARGKHRA